MKSKLGFIVSVLVVLSLLLAACGNTAKTGSSGEEPQESSKNEEKPQEVMVLKVGHSANSNEPYHAGLEAMDKKLQELTNGEVKLEIFPSQQLGDEREMVEAVQSGNLNMAVTANGILTNFSKDFLILDLPYLFRDQDHLYNVLDGQIGQEMAKTLSQKNLHVLAYYFAGTRHIMNSVKPINSIDDLKGMKIRVLQNPIHIASFKAFGANPTPISYNELYTSLQQKVVQGAEAANTNYFQQKFYEVSNHWAQVEWLYFTSELVVNDKWFNALPDDVKHSIQEAAAYSAGVERKVYEESDNTALEGLKSQGVKITQPDTKPFRDAAQKVWEEFADQVGGMERIQEIQAVK